MKTLFTALTTAIGYILCVLILGMLIPTIVCIILANVTSDTFIEWMCQPGYVISTITCCIGAMIYYGVTVYNN